MISLLHERRRNAVEILRMDLAPKFVAATLLGFMLLIFVCSVSRNHALDISAVLLWLSLGCTAFGIAIIENHAVRALPVKK